jgi:SpoVK/Ycf46/Vps4 family AAA+-type ATPase
MATNRPDTLDPALLRPGRLDRKVEFGLPDLESRTQIFQIHTRAMACERDIRFELLARLCPNSTGADIRSVCTEAVSARAGRGRAGVEQWRLSATARPAARPCSGAPRPRCPSAQPRAQGPPFTLPSPPPQPPPPPTHPPRACTRSARAARR